MVTDGCVPACSPPIEITISDDCELPPPPCPTIVWDASTTAVGAKCPGDMLNLCVSTNATCGTVNLPVDTGMDCD